jgi:RimJ/RimL family protein N-acetyltransferase
MRPQEARSSPVFPDLTRDDDFRFETKRLTMRWPRATDAAAIAGFAALADVAAMTADIPHPYPQGEAERFILAARARNAAGEALHLVVAPKAAGCPVAGLVSAQTSGSKDVELTFVVAPAAAGKGLATEAVRMLLDLVFDVTLAVRIVAKSRVVNLAARRVLEKNGFRHEGSSLVLLPARGGDCPCDGFQLDRAAWHRTVATKRMPPMMLQRRAVNEMAQEAAE